MKISNYRVQRWATVAALSVLTPILGTACSDVGFELTPEGLENALMSDPNLKTEDFSFGQDRPKAKVDVMFVIDNSGSMYDEQQKLAARLSSFVGSLNNVDWQIGITTSDVSTGPYGVQGSLVTMSGTSSHLLTPLNPNYGQVFTQTITDHGTPLTCGGTAPTSCPSGDEQPLRAIQLAVDKRNSDNRGFFRDNSDLVTIILTDEDEMSNGTGYGSVLPTTPATIVNTVKAAFGNKSYTSFGIIVEPGDMNCFNQQGFSGTGPFGTFAATLAQMTGGATGSICAEDYGATLASIGQRVTRTATALKLKENADPSTVRVRIMPFDPNLTWEFKNNSIVLNDQPMAGTIVRVFYLPMGSN